MASGESNSTVDSDASSAGPPVLQTGTTTRLDPATRSGSASSSPPSTPNTTDVKTESPDKKGFCKPKVKTSPSTASTTPKRKSTISINPKKKRKKKKKTTKKPAPKTPPTPDPTMLYEWKQYRNRVPNRALKRLKDVIRAKNGFPVKQRKKKRKCRPDLSRPPRTQPKSNVTSRKRMEVQRHKLIARCTNILKMLENLNRLSKLPPAESKKEIKQLRSEVMSKTTDDIDFEAEQEELENLRHLAEREKQNIISSKDNKVSKLRFQLNRGQPVISSHFRENFLDYQKPPFCPASTQFKIERRNLPKIDKYHEIWLLPVEATIESPVPPPKRKDEASTDKRPAREKARPPITRKGKRVVRDASKQPTTQPDESKTDASKSVQKRKPRPPWKMAKPLSCLFNIDAIEITKNR